MAESVSIKVSVTGSGKQDLLEIKKLVTELNNSAVNIKVNTGKGTGSVKEGTEAVKGAAKAVQDLKVAVQSVNGEETKRIRVFDEKGNLVKVIQDSTTAIGKFERVTSTTRGTTRQLTDDLKKQAEVLTDQSRAAHTAAVRAGALAKADGELVKSQEFWRDGQLIKAVNTYKDSLGNTTKVTSELVDGNARVTTSYEKVKKVVKDTTAETEKSTKATKQSGKEFKETSKSTALLGDSLTRIIAKMAAWQVLGNVIATLLRSFREAVQTMKDVDQELTNINKVSNLTATSLERIGEQAYDVASKYGVSAKEYLEAVYTFKKAGIGDSAEALAELATKTMLVGDTTAEIATQFLISANAAWKFGGDVAALSKIVDEADYINNNYATTLADIATGLPIVGATAAQVGMTAEEAMAAIGTIVASTGQTASKAATALRAIIMNLIGQTGELDDGVTVTEESIKSLNDVLNKYAPDALAAAEATGSIINPLEAIAALAAAAEDPLVTESELFSVLASLGGKLRTTQLAALVNNLDMANSMLDGMANAAGTADGEITKMLESWNAKTQILKNTWAKFISNLLETKTFKDIIVALTKAVEFLDTGFGRATITIISLGLAITKVYNIAVKTIALVKSGEKLRGLISLIMALTTAIKGGASAVEIFKTVWNTSPFVVITVAIAAIYGIVKALDALIVTYNEHMKKAAELYDAYKQIQSELESIEEQYRKNHQLIIEGNEAGADERYLTRLINENEQLSVQYGLLKASAELKRQAAEREYLKAYSKTQAWMGGGHLNYGNILEKGYYYLDQAQEGWDVSDKLAPVLDTLAEMYDAFAESTNKTAKLYASQIQGFLDKYNILFPQSSIDSGTGGTGGTSTLSDKTAETNQYSRALEIAAAAEAALNAESMKGTVAYDKLKARLDPLTKAYAELAEKGEMSEDTWRALRDAYGNLKVGIDGTLESGGNLNDVLVTMIQLVLKGAGYSEEFVQVLNGEGVEAKNAADSTQVLADSIESVTEKFKEYNEQIDAVQSSLKTITDAQAEYEETGNLSVDTIQALLALDREYLDALIDENGQINLTSEAVETLIEGKNVLVNRLAAEAVASYAVEEAQRLMAEQTGAAGNASEDASTKIYDAAAAALELAADAAAGAAAMDALSQAVKNFGGEAGLNADNSRQLVDNVLSYYASVKSVLSGIDIGLGGWSGSGGSKSKSGGSGSSSDTRLEELKKIISLRKQELSYLEASGASSEEQVQKMREIQAALHDQAEYMRSIGADEEDILKLSTEWWTYQEKITKSLKESALALLEIQKESVIGPMQTQLDLLKSQSDAAKDAREEEEKRLAVEKARIALENAQNERNVRQYNAKTGQWEWVANAQTIQSAQDALTSAQQALDDYYKSSQIASLEASIKAAEASYDAMKSAINNGDIINLMKANSAAWFDADEAGRARLAEENLILGSSQGWTRKNGTWYDANGRQIYDSGGILHGVGGIKATRADEMVLPPRMTSALLDAEQTGAFDALLRHLGIVTAVGQSYAGFGGGISANSIGSQHNGDVYQIGGVTMTEQQARCMTIYDLARLSRTLSLHNA